MDEEPLTGGNITAQVVRVGDTVRRTRGPRAGFVESLLRHLETVGYAYAPRHLGIDDRGREVLSYIPGATSDHHGERADGAYRTGGRMLRELHEATAGQPLADGRECVVHGDPGPFNTIFRAGLPVAFIDWDFASPGESLGDLGYMAWTWCLVYGFDEHGGVLSSDQIAVSDQAEHLRELLEGYGDVADPGDLLQAMVRAQEGVAASETANLDNPELTPARRRHAHTAIAWATAGKQLVEDNEAALLEVLRRVDRPSR